MAESVERPDDPKKLAELEKLRLETEDLRQQSKWRWLTPASTIGSAVIAVAGFLFGVHQFSAAQNAQTEAELSRQRSETLAREQEFRKRFWEERLSLYRRVCAATGKIAARDTLADVATEREVFWSAYWGEMSILEDRGVLAAMVRFGEALRLAERGDGNVNDALRQGSYQLARACRNSLSATWEIAKVDDIPTMKPASATDQRPTTEPVGRPTTASTDEKDVKTLGVREGSKGAPATKGL